MKRKHAELIHAWADGAEIQFKDGDGTWEDCSPRSPAWDNFTEYRIKPKTKTVRFRNYMYDGNIKVHVPGTAIPPPGDMKWIGDWRTVEVEIEQQ